MSRDWYSTLLPDDVCADRVDAVSICLRIVDIPVSELASHRHFLLGVARSLLRNPALAEDAVHDVFEAVLSGRADFQGRSTLRTWLVGVLRHKATDMLRTLRHHETFGDDGATQDTGFQPICPRPQPDQVYELCQALEQVALGMSALPLMMQDVLQLRVIDDLAASVVCEELSITPGNLGVRLHRARAILRKSAVRAAASPAGDLAIGRPRFAKGSR